MDYLITDHGAQGSDHDHTAAIQGAIDACRQAGGGRLVVPPGRWTSGQLQLCSHLDVHLCPGAVLAASIDPGGYAASHGNCLLEAEGCEDLAISGLGTIDGNGAHFVAKDLGTIFQPADWRPGLVHLRRCRRLRISGVRFADSANWTVHLLGCEDVVIRDITIANSLKMPNCDGIDPDRCRRVTISGCHITCADDAIVLKATAGNEDCGDCEDILVSDCTLKCTASALKIGTESAGSFRNIGMQNCVVRNSSRAITIQLRDQGDVERVCVQGCSLETRLFDDWYWGTAELVHISAMHRGGSVTGNPDGHLGTVRDVVVSDCHGRGEGGVVIHGEEPGHIERITIRDCDLLISKTSKWPAGTLDLRPCTGEGHHIEGIGRGSDNAGYQDHPVDAVHVIHAHDVRLRDVRVRWDVDGDRAYRHLLFAHGVRDLDDAGLMGSAAHADVDARQVSD